MGAETTYTIVVPTKASKDQDWMSFYTVLRQDFGSKEAQSLWWQAWGVRGGANANTNTLIEFQRENKFEHFIKPDGTFQAFSLGASDFVGSVGDSLGGMFGTLKWGAYILGGVLILAVSMAAINIARNPIGAISAAK